MPDINLIDTIVIVMMENRSFDNMLGHLSCQKYGNRTEVDGLRCPLQKKGYENMFEGLPYYPFEMADRMLPSDLPHDRDEITIQFAYSPVSGAYTMSGFVKAYFELTPVNRVEHPEPMGFYPPDQVPITNFLANNFAVCDQWFSPLPTSTVPNRLISLSGESRVDFTGLFPQEGRIILDWLSDHGIRWRVYHVGLSFFTLLGRLPQVFGPNFRKVENLERDVRLESPAEFPQVILIEPSYFDALHFGADIPNDNHAPLAVGFGEVFLRQIYKALTSNPEKWKKTVMILTYDEHGGFFDHVPPLPIPYSPPNQEYIPFETTGVRVPSIVISPFVAPRSIYKGNLDHTSILQFIAERFAREDNGYSEAVNKRRDQGIGSVSQVLNLDIPRTDIPVAPATEIHLPSVIDIEGEGKKKGHMQAAFEEVSSIMVEKWPSNTERIYPELYHGLLSKRG